MFDNQWMLILEGNKEAFLAFYEENYQRLYAYGYRLCGNKELTKDSIQELFLELWKSRKIVDPGVRNVPSYLMTWLRRIIGRQVKSIHRQGSKTPGAEEQLQELSYVELLVEHQTDEEKKKRLRDALLQLTPGQLRIIQLRFFENKTFQEIADESNLAKQTVYNVLYKALIILRQVIGELNIVLYPVIIPLSLVIYGHAAH